VSPKVRQQLLGYFTSFRVRDGKTQLLLETPSGSPGLCDRQHVRDRPLQAPEIL
jgi:hypothetical protein